MAPWQWYDIDGFSVLYVEMATIASVWLILSWRIRLSYFNYYLCMTFLCEFLLKLQHIQCFFFKCEVWDTSREELPLIVEKNLKWRWHYLLWSKWSFNGIGLRRDISQMVLTLTWYWQVILRSFCTYLWVPAGLMKQCNLLALQRGTTF